MAALARVDDVEGSWLRARLDDAFAVVAGRFFRREVRVRARACLGGMLSGLERKTSWSLAEHAGETAPDGMQRLFTTARWDADLVRDDLRDYVAGALGDPDGVLIGDDTGFEKGGTRSAGVQRQYTGTAGKITNCQIGVFLAYASGQGRALVDRELYLPRSWTGDPLRLAAAGVPAGTGFATKPELLQQMIKRAAAAGMPFGWVAADEAYGDNGPLRDYLGRGSAPFRRDCSQDCSQGAEQHPTHVDNSGISAQPTTSDDGPGRCAHSYGSDAPVGPHVVQTIPASSGAGWACIIRWSAPVSISSFSQIGACLSPGVNRCPNRTPGKL